MRPAAFAAPILAAAVACGPRPVDGVTVTRQQIDLEVLEDGSVVVADELTIQVDAAGPVAFERRVPLARADAYFDAAATLDGRLIGPDGSPAADLTVDDGLRARWAFQARGSSRHRLALTWRAAGAVAREGPRGTLRWTIAPIVPGYDVLATHVTLALPERSHWLDPAALTGADWNVVTGAGGLRADAGARRAEEALDLTAHFSVDGLGIVEPAWQFRAARATQLAPAWASGGLFMVVVAIGIVWMVRVQYPGDRRRLARLRADLPPSSDLGGAAMRMALARGGRVRGLPEWRAASAAATAAAGAGGRAALRHEQVVQDAEWLHADRDAADDGDAGRAASRAALRRFREALTFDLIDAGLVSAERVAVAVGLQRSAIVVAVVSCVLAALLPWLLPGFGRWPYALPIGMLLGAALIWPAGARLSRLSDAGVAARRVAG
jgi:hypothetical protein